MKFSTTTKALGLAGIGLFAYGYNCFGNDSNFCPDRFWTPVMLMALAIGGPAVSAVLDLFDTKPTTASTKRM